MAAAAVSGEGRQAESSSESKGNGLLLYHYYHSFYSQKVILALHEKKLSFTTRHVDFDKQEHFQDHFLKINPQADVPVLQDGIRVIPESQRIIDYLEDNFSNGDMPRLIPLDQASLAVRQSVIYYRQMLDSHPMDVIVAGCLLYPDALGRPREPFVGSLAARLQEESRILPQQLRNLARRNPEFKDALLQRAKEEEEKMEKLRSRASFQEVLDNVVATLNQLEVYLASHEEEGREQWLCSMNFTAADVSLSLLLHWLSLLGLERFLGERPHLESYLQRARQRDSFQKAVFFPKTSQSSSSFISFLRCQFQWWWSSGRWDHAASPSCPCRNILLGLGASTLVLLSVFLYVKRWRK